VVAAWADVTTEIASVPVGKRRKQSKPVSPEELGTGAVLPNLDKRRQPPTINRVAEKSGT
jgi:hypothetical protein